MKPRHTETISAAALVVRRAVRPLHAFRLPAPLKRPIDSLEALHAERSETRPTVTRS